MSEINSLFSFFVDQTAYNENMWYAAREEKEELTPPHPLTANPTPHPPIPNPTPHSLAPPATPISLTLSPAHPLTRSPPKPAAAATPTTATPTRYAARAAEHAHGLSVRVMSYLCNMNSKSLFRYALDDAELMRGHRPVSVHINYHPEKLPRMQDVFERYHGLGPDLGAGYGLPSPRSSAGGLKA